MVNAAPNEQKPPLRIVSEALSTPSPMGARGAAASTMLSFGYIEPIYHYDKKGTDEATRNGRAARARSPEG